MQGSKNSRNPEAPEGTQSQLQSYRAAELHSYGKHTHPWVVGGHHRGRPSYLGEWYRWK